MKKVIYILMSVALLASCDPHENEQYDNVNGKTLLGFNASTINVPVNIGTEDFDSDQTVTISVSTISDMDRTFNVSASEESTLSAGNYDLPATVTVPANSYNADFTIGFQDEDLTTSGAALVLELSGDDVAFNTPVTLNVFQVCPIPETYFVGDYEISDNDIVFGGTNFTTRVVNVEIGSSATQRVFTTDWSGGPAFQVELNLVCNELIYASENRTGFTGGGEPIIILPATENDSTYDIDDDSFFIVEYDNLAGSFGTFEGSFFLIKE